MVRSALYYGIYSLPDWVEWIKAGADIFQIGVPFAYWDKIEVIALAMVDIQIFVKRNPTLPKTKSQNNQE